jgi:predicted secreted protein
MEELTVKVNQEFKIILEAIPDAGYMWLLRETPNYIEVVDRLVKLNRSVGGSSDEIFTLRANKVGEYILTFDMKRYWEKDVTRNKVYKVIVK